MKDIIDVLGSLGELEHWTSRPCADPAFSDMSYPPLITFRYADASEDLAISFQRAIETFPGTVTWLFLTTGKNWALMPSRIKEHAKLRGYVGEVEAYDDIANSDPAFGRLANSELPFLAAHIEECVHCGQR